MRFSQTLLNPSRTYAFWRISHNKIVRYLNNQTFSDSVSNNSVGVIATANTVNVVNDVLNTANGTLNTANGYNTTSEAFLNNLQIQNNAATEVLNYANTVIESYQTDFGLDISGYGSRFNVIPVIDANGFINVGDKIFFHEANTPNTIDYELYHDYNYEFDTLDYLQPSIKISGTEIIVNRGIISTGVLEGNSFSVHNPDMDTLFSSNGDISSKKSEWLNLVNAQGNTTLINETPVIVLQGTIDNSFSLITASPKKWTGSQIGIQFLVSGAETGNSANLSVSIGTISEAVLIDNDPEQNYLTINLGSTANSVIQTDVININTQGNKEDLIVLNISRNVSEADDTLVGNLYIHGMKIIYDTEKLTDA